VWLEWRKRLSKKWAIREAQYCSCSSPFLHLVRSWIPSRSWMLGRLWTNSLAVFPLYSLCYLIISIISRTTDVVLIYWLRLGFQFIDIEGTLALRFEQRAPSAWPAAQADWNVISDSWSKKSRDESWRSQACRESWSLKQENPGVV
jgi:hypothetical protein